MTDIYLIAVAVLFLSALTGMLFKIWRLEEAVDQFEARLLSIEHRRQASAPPPLATHAVNMPKFL